MQNNEVNKADQYDYYLKEISEKIDSIPFPVKMLLPDQFSNEKISKVIDHFSKFDTETKMKLYNIYIWLTNEIKIALENE